MSEWCQRTLGDLIHVKHGYAFKGEFFVEEGEKLVLKPGNFPIGGGITLRPGKDAYYTGDYPPDFELAAGDLLVVMTDLTQAAPILGAPAFVPAEPVMLHNQRLGLVQVKPGVEVDRRFLYYAMLSDTSRSQIRATATGATVRHTAPERIYRVKLGIPDLSTQRVIGDVLGSIDDLIENNRRRIEVLEEMARAIYREWFVKFRYPGHEGVPLVDSALGPIPEEWTVRRLDELATFVGGSTRTKAAYVDAGYVAFSAAGPDGFVPDYEVDGPGVVLSAVGAKCGRTFWASGKWSSIANTIKILPKEPELFANWLRFATDDSSVWPKRGSAQPFVSINDARGVLSRVATRETHLRFEDAVKPMVDQAVVLEAGARGLAALRDLLLPKLVTGQIDVTSLDLDAAIAEQVA